MSELTIAYPSLELLDPPLAAALHSEAVEARVHAGTVVFEAADFCKSYPLLVEGTARVVKIGAGSRDTLLYRLRAGEHCLLSAAGLLARWRFGATVTAESDLRAFVVPAPLFRRLVRDVPEFAHAIHIAIARRLEIVLDLVEQATHFRLDQRVATLLLGRGQRLGASHQELADDLGTSRENISRVLEMFQLKGWVVLGRRRIEVADPSALETFLDN
jgi:CRP/FNR family transcriptional regulator